MAWILVYNPTDSSVVVDNTGRAVTPSEFGYADKGQSLITGLLNRRELIEIPITFDPNGSPVGIDPEAFLAAGEVIIRNGGEWEPPVDPPVEQYTLAQIDTLLRTGRLSAAALSASIRHVIPPAQGSSLVRRMVDSPVMASPPTLTASTAVPSGMTVTKQATTNFNFGTYWPHFRVSGAPLIGLGSINQAFAKNARKTDNSTSAWGGTERLEFDFDGADFAFRLQAVAGAFVQVWVNEERITAGMVGLQSVAGAANGSTNHYKVDFGSRAYRRIVIEWAAQSSAPTNFTGIVHRPTDTLFAPSIPSLRFGVLGDSIAWGTGADANNQAYSIQLGRLLGFADIWNFMAFPSTGVLDTNDPFLVGNYASRLDVDVIPNMRDGDVLIYQGSLNDRTYDPALVQSQVTADLAKIIEARPGLHIVVTCPLFTGTPTLDAATQDPALRSALNAAANVAGVPYVDVSSMFTGTGRVGATTGDGNADYYMSSDAVHPSTAGHLALARALAAKIAPLIGQTR